MKNPNRPHPPTPPFYLAGLLLLVCLYQPLPGQSPPYLIDLQEALSAGWSPGPFFQEMDLNTITGFAGEFGTANWMESDHPAFNEFIRIELNNEPAENWSAGLNTTFNPMPIQEGEWILASFYARKGPDTGQAMFEAFIQRPQPDWIRIENSGGRLTGEWTRFYVLGQAQQDFPPDTVNFTIHLGQTIQTVDIAGLSVLHLNASTDPDAVPVSPIAYEGMADDAEWRTQARQMIETHRMGDWVLELRNSQGQSLSGATVTIELQTHAYPFGSFFSRLIVEDGPEAEQYARWFKDNFNAATNPVYWADWGWANPVRQQNYRDMADWLQTEGIPTRGHVLIYPGWNFAPQELRDLANDPEAFQARIIQHLEEIVPIMKAYGVREYDVTNELRHLSDFTDIVGMVGVVAWFRKVRELDPDAVLYINENTILSAAGLKTSAQDHYFQTIHDLLAHGAPLDGIGMQGHFDGAVTDPERLWEILDRFATFGLPIRITEYDLSTRDFEGQARYDSDFYTTIFAHPATAGLTRWGYYEPEMWRPLGAIIDSEGVYKPNGIAQRQLLFEDWSSRETLTSDKNGQVRFHAFYGNYKVSVLHRGVLYESNLDFRKSSSTSASPMILPITSMHPRGKLKLRMNNDQLELTFPQLPPTHSATLKRSHDMLTWVDQDTSIPLDKDNILHWKASPSNHPVFYRLRIEQVK